VEVEAAVRERFQAHQPHASRRPAGDALGHQGLACSTALPAGRDRERTEPGQGATGDREERPDQRAGVGRHETAVGVRFEAQGEPRERKEGALEALPGKLRDDLDESAVGKFGDRFQLGGPHRPDLEHQALNSEAAGAAMTYPW
jgi:hypothetical protein